MKTPVRLLLITILALVQVSPAFAWGPRTEVTVISAAVRLISRDSNIPLARLEDEIKAGAADDHGLRRRDGPHPRP